MAMKIPALMLTTVVIIAVAAPSKHGNKTPCCGPKQFMAGIDGTVGKFFRIGEGKKYYIHKYGAFDFVRRTFGYQVTVTFGNGSSIYLRVIQKFAQGSQWIIKDDVEACIMQPTGDLEPNICISDKARYVDSFVVGGNENRLLLDKWDYDYWWPLDPIDGLLSVSVVQGTCYPAIWSFVGELSPLEATAVWTNITLGIPDPDKWFTVPSFCFQETNHISSRHRRSLAFYDHLNLPRFF